jgi:hypothetical protein
MPVVDRYIMRPVRASNMTSLPYLPIFVYSSNLLCLLSLHLLSRPPCLSYLRSPLPPKGLHRLIINRSRRSTSFLESLVLTLVEHVLLEVAVNPRFVGLEARLLFEVAVAKVVAIARVFD